MLLQAIVNGLLFGAVYALIGIGFTLVWGVMNIINVAHGALIVVGAYLSFALFAMYGIDPFLSIPGIMAALFLFGYCVQKYLLNLVVRGSVFITLTFTFGLMIIVQNGCLLIWGADYRSVRLAYSAAAFEIGDIVVPYVRLGIFAVALLLTFFFYVFMRSTKTGIAISATALNIDGARTVGIDVAKTYAMTFGVSAALAGAAGALFSPIMSIGPFLGNELIGRAFVIAVLGGLGSTVGALLGGILLGLVETVGTIYLPTSFQELLGFIVLVVVLLVRPTGLLGRRQ
jgi:branched-chain amino acid transport system permease protein